MHIPKFLLKEYPDEITIVLQHQFDELVVTNDYFEVYLVFNGRRTKLKVPFNAVTSFADPSVNFGLQMGFGLENNLTVDPELPLSKNYKEGKNKNTAKNRNKGRLINSEKSVYRRDNSQRKNKFENLKKEEIAKQSSRSKTADVIALDKFRKK